MKCAFIQVSLSVLALTVILGCNRGDKPQAWEANHARPMQEAIAADMQDAQPPVGDPSTSTPGEGVASLRGKAGEVDVEDMHWTAPKNWVAKDPSSRFVNAEFKLPKADGDSADGRLTVSTVGGNVEQNIERWRAQFGGKPEKQSTESFDVAGIKTTLVDLEGTFKEGGGPMMAAAAVDRPGYRMIGAIAQRNDTLIVVKATGPAKTIAARADEIKAFVKSLKIDNRGDKAQPMETNQVRRAQETVAADMQDKQSPTAQTPAEHPPVAPAADGVAKMDGKPVEVDVGDMRWTAPKNWVTKEPSSNFVNAEFKLPKVEGDSADGRLTVSTVGGNVEQNVERWRGQFVGKPEKQSTDSFEVAGIKTTLVDLEGTFKDGGPMMAAGAVDRPGYRLIGAISQRGDTLIVVKATGPVKTIAARADEIKAFAKSLKIDK